MSKTPSPLRNVVAKAGHTRIVLAGLGTVSVLALLVGGGLDPKTSTAAPPRTPSAIQVNSAVATASDVPVYLGGLGTVQAFYTATVAPRLPLRLGGEWEGTALTLPGRHWRNELTGEEISGETILLAELLRRFPVALLSRID